MTSDPMIRDDEELHDLQLRGLQILQKKHGFRYGMDAVLLADFAKIGPHDVFADFGTGTGVLPFLLFGRDKGCRAEAFELQAEFAEMAKRSVFLNGLTDKISIHHADVTDAEA